MPRPKALHTDKGETLPGLGSHRGRELGPDDAGGQDGCYGHWAGERPQMGHGQDQNALCATRGTRGRRRTGPARTERPQEKPQELLGMLRDRVNAAVDEARSNGISPVLAIEGALRGGVAELGERVPRGGRRCELLRELDTRYRKSNDVVEKKALARKIWERRRQLRTQRAMEWTADLARKGCLRKPAGGKLDALQLEHPDGRKARTVEEAVELCEAVVGSSFCDCADENLQRPAATPFPCL